MAFQEKIFDTAQFSSIVLHSSNVKLWQTRHGETNKQVDIYDELCMRGDTKTSMKISETGVKGSKIIMKEQ